MNLIERYAAEVGKHLPKRNRSDIQEEICSTLEDMLEDRARKARQPADEEMTVSLLKEFGKPEDVAASYLPPKQLVGPLLYPLYSLVVKITLPILAVVLTVTLGIGLLSGERSTAGTLRGVGQAALEVASALISAFGSITLTFAILERIPWKALHEKEPEEDWDPRSLPEVSEVEKFSLPGLAVEAALSAAALIVLNFFPHILGIGFTLNGKWTFLPLLAEAFFRYVPFINALLGLEIVLNLFLLRRGRWQAATRWLRIGLRAAWLALAIVMLAGPELVRSGAEAVALLGSEFTPEAADFLLLLPRWVAKGTLALIVVLDGIEMVTFLRQEVGGKSRS
jgi:hypothetical protein